MVIGTDSRQKYELLVPAEAVALIVRAFGETRLAVVQKMSLKQLTRETTRAVHALIGQRERFAVGDIVRWRLEKAKEGV